MQNTIDTFQALPKGTVVQKIGMYEVVGSPSWWGLVAVEAPNGEPRFLKDGDKPGSDETATSGQQNVHFEAGATKWGDWRRVTKLFTADFVIEGNVSVDHSGHGELLCAFFGRLDELVSAFFVLHELTNG